MWTVAEVTEWAVAAGMPARSDLTPREVFVIAIRRKREAWAHTAQICSVIANVMGGNNTTTADFNPFEE